MIHENVAPVYAQPFIGLITNENQYTGTSIKYLTYQNYTQIYQQCQPTFGIPTAHLQRAHAEQHQKAVMDRNLLSQFLPNPQETGNQQTQDTQESTQVPSKDEEPKFCFTVYTQKIKDSFVARARTCFDKRSEKQSRKLELKVDPYKMQQKYAAMYGRVDNLPVAADKEATQILNNTNYVSTDNGQSIIRLKHAIGDGPHQTTINEELKKIVIPPKQYTDEAQATGTASSGKVEPIRTFRGRPRMQITACPHKTERHYAKGMCINCYNDFGRSNRAKNCQHRHRQVYARGMCQKCYCQWYNNVGKSQILDSNNRNKKKQKLCKNGA